MTNLTINDLSKSTDLDSKEMAAVTGGYGMSHAACCLSGYGGGYSVPSGSAPYGGPSLGLAKNDMNLNVAQSLDQSQNTLVNNGNNAAFVSGITSNVAPSQNGSNNVSLF